MLVDYRLLLDEVCAMLKQKYPRKMEVHKLALCSLCILFICNFSFSRFRYGDRIWVLNAPVPGHCLLVAFYT